MDLTLEFLSKDVSKGRIFLEPLLLSKVNGFAYQLNIEYFTNYMRKLIVICVFGFHFFKIHAQNSIVTTGGDVSGPNGKVTYTIGQMNYTTDSSPDGSVSTGVQQPYEIMVISGITKTEINMVSSVYPNPAGNSITLSVNSDQTKNMSYMIYDSNGKILNHESLKGKQTLIPMNEFSNGSYMIKVINEKEELKTFRIIKNN